VKKSENRREREYQDCSLGGGGSEIRLADERRDVEPSSSIAREYWKQVRMV
jgi:hypothetical protein